MSWVVEQIALHSLEIPQLQVLARIIMTTFGQTDILRSFRNISFNSHHPHQLFSMSFRYSNGESSHLRERSPGPGAYEQSSRILNRSMPSFRIGTGQRENYQGGKNTPGPGYYQLRSHNSYGADSGPKYP